MMSQTSAHASMSGIPQPVTQNHGAEGDVARCLQLLTRHYDNYCTEFRQLTRRAAGRFSQCDWAGSQADEVERPKLFELHALRTSADMTRCGLSLSQKGWMQLKSQYAAMMSTRCEHTLAMLFLARVHGLQESRSSLNLASECPVDMSLANAPEPDLRSRECVDGTAEALVPLLAAVPTDTEWHDLHTSAARVGARIDEHLQEQAVTGQSVELLMPVLYRFTRAYIIGAVNHQRGKLPFALSVRTTTAENGMMTDDLIIDATALRKLFEQKGATFHIDAAEIPAVATYLQQFIPVRTADILSTLGWPTLSWDAA